MSHFCVLVIGDNHEGQLAKYDENLELPMHQVASKEELIAEQKRWIEDYKNGTYAEFLKDPKAYKAKCENERHIKYLEEVFPKMLGWSDEQCYENRISDYRDYINDGETWCEIHEDGSLWKTTNENAKWDWYQMGGRYRGHLKLKVPRMDAPLYNGWPHENKNDYDRLKKEGYCDQAYSHEVENLDEFVPFAIVKDGEWHQRGKCGWWGIVTDENDNWDEEAKSLKKDLPYGTLLTVIDCHI